jgi:acyl-CoA reductase-like NAD-dependent aldehyde dehydrogenase
VTQKLGPALITGNTVVAKPAPTTPMCALKIAELAADIFPAGVINVIVDNNDLGAALSSHPDVAKVSFTGSTGTGRKIFAAGADDLKRITLELGGNDAAIVMDDVDPKTVAPKLFNGAMVNAGQVCLAIKRVYADASIYDELCAELATLAENAVVDDGANQGAQIGPVQNKMQYDKLLGFLDDAAANGTVLAGGKPLDRDGYFIAPTIVRDIADDSRLVREEQFGPILPIMKFDDIDDAITRANDNEYGLGGTIWAGDVDRGVEVAMKIDSGTVWVNKHLDLPFDVPFGGSKQSGIGREGGDEGLFAYSQPHVVNIAKAAV